MAIGSISNDPEEFNSLKVAKQVITKEYPDGMDKTASDLFKTSFVCYVIGMFLVAKSKANHGMTDYWGSLLELDKLQSFNFCKMVIDEIIESAIKVQYHLKANKPIPILSGYSLFLQGFYLIMRTLKIEKPADNVPLIAGLDCENIKTIMMADKEAQRMMAEVGSASSFGVSGTPFIDRKQVYY